MAKYSEMGFSLVSQSFLVVVVRPGSINNQPTRFSLTHRPTIQHRPRALFSQSPHAIKQMKACQNE